ncbi:MAG: GAF domain-containing protein, partial [Cyanobacteria bacterium J06555_13]
QGNPFFTTQFLLGLHEKGCITFNVDAGHWQCDLGQAKQLALTDDVVAFMVERLKQLPLPTQEVLKLAACIGNQFDLETLTVICDRTTNIATDLWSTLQEGLVIPESETYKFFQDSTQTLETGKIANATYRFLHDRVQQAAYALISEADKQKIHLKIGQRLLQQTAQTSPQDQEASLFLVVGQLNMGRDLLTTHTERQHLAQLNLQAGRKAKRSTAYSTAMGYLTVAQSLLGADRWEQDYQTTLEISVESLETAYLSTRFDEVEDLAASLLKRTRTLLDSIQVHEVRIRAWIGRGDQHKALEIGLEVLAMLEISLLEAPPSEPNDIGALVQLPAMSAPDKLMAMDIMAGIITSAWAVNPVCFRQLTFTMVELSIEYGNCPASAFGYAWHGSLLCEALGNIEAGYAFGQLAVALLDTLNAKALRSKVLNIYATCIGCWQGPVKDCLTFHLDGLQSGLDTGDLEFASYDAAEYAQYLFLMGMPLETVRAECQQKLSIIEHLKQTFHVDYLAPWLQGTLNLLGKSVETTTLDGEIYREQDRLPALVEDNQLTLVFVTYFVKSFLSYLFEAYEQALAQGEIARSHSTGVTGSLFIPTELFYSSLARMACLQAMDKPQQQAALADVERCLVKLKNWATNAPMNFQHKCDLIAAELANHHRQFAQAIEHYDAAIAGAQKHQYFQEEAIANELAAKFYLNWGKERVAASYLQEAYYCYVRWGAKAKTDHLEQHYPQLLSAIAQPPMSQLVIPASHPTFHPPLEPASNPPVFNPKETLATLAAPTRSISASTRTSTTSLNTDLNFDSVLKASQALSGTIQIDKLLSQLTTLILQQSGGDHCALILGDSEGTWQLKALATPSNIRLVSEPLDNHPNLPVKLLHYVKNTQKEIVIDNLKTDLPVIGAYLYRTKPKSLLCLPLRNQGQLLGMLYLHNQSTSGVFTQNHIHILKFLCTQAAISLENARLYQQSEAYAQQIEQSQLQTVQNEKMASLGNLVAGVAHEINNPIGFINGSVKNATAYLQDLLGHLELYQQHYPQPIEPIEDNAEEIDLEFLTEDFPKLLKSMQGANQRIKSISNSLRTFSRADTACKVSANLHEGIDSTILILKYRLKGNEHRPTIQVVTDYGDLPTVDCFLGQLNQVFMNILANAIDIFDEAAEQATFQGIAGFAP